MGVSGVSDGNVNWKRLLLAGLVVGLTVLSGIGSGIFVVTAEGEPANPKLATITVDLEPAKDNTLYESATGSLSNGEGAFLFVGQTNGGMKRRALLAFDVAGIVPASATILSATLTLNMSRSISGNTAVSLHTVEQDWGEGESDAAGEEGEGAAAAPGDATWLHTFFNTATWTQAGGDFDPTPVATTDVGGPGSYQWESPELLADVQEWLESPESNNGWILLGNENAPTTAKRFDSGENPTTDNRPRLTITYSAELSQLFLPVALDEN